MNGTSSNRRRAVVYAVIAAMLGFLIGYLEQGTVGGGFVLGLAAGVAVPLGLFFVNIVSRYIDR